MGIVHRRVPVPSEPSVGARRSPGVGTDAPAADADGPAVVGTALAHRYEGPSGPVPVLVDVTFTVPRDGYAALVGPSGAGKTTLLSLIGGLERVQTGSQPVEDGEGPLGRVVAR